MKLESLTPTSKRTFLFEIVVGIILVASLFYIKIPATEHNATLILALPSEQRTFTGEVVEDMTVYEAILAALSTANLEFPYPEQEGGLEIYINDQPIDPATIEEVRIHGGDTIRVVVRQN